MKIVYTVCLLFALAGCKKDDVNNDLLIREIAWTSLPASEKSTVITQWQHAAITSERYQNMNVHAVLFNTIDDALLGPIIVYVSKSSRRVVGSALRY